MHGHGKSPLLFFANATDRWAPLPSTNGNPMTRPTLTALALCCLSAPAFCESLPQTHDGLFLAFGLGFGYGSLSTEGTIPTSLTTTSKLEMTNTGISNTFDFRLGGTVMQDLAVHATLSGDAIAGPKTEMTVNGKTKSGDVFNSIGFTLMGAGVTKYFMPTNLFVSASGGVATFQAEDTSGASGRFKDRGFGLQGKVGKEWWISPNWALGVSGVVNWATISPSGETDKYLGTGIQFSATYW